MTSSWPKQGAGRRPNPGSPRFKEPPATSSLRPWRDVCQPHPDVLSARFSDAEFAANLALVDQGVGSEEYVDPVAFFRITYATEGLTRVLTSTLARLAGRGGDPVIGLQTNFGGGKTHTMLALHHLVGALPRRGYRPRGSDWHGAGLRGCGRLARSTLSVAPFL